MKILFSLGSFGFLRNFEPAVRLLAQHGHDIHLVADRKDNVGGIKTLELLERDYPARIRHSYATVPKDPFWYPLGTQLRLTLDYWRYLDAPSFAYRVLLAERDGQPAGYAAYRLHETPNGTVGFIADLFTAKDDAGGRDTLMVGTIEAIRAAGADHVSTLAIPGTPLYRAFRRAVFLRGRGAFGVQIVPLGPSLPLERMRDPNSWGMAGGDFDVI